MYETHDGFHRYHATYRSTEAERRAADHRIRVAAGVDLHARAVRALGSAIDRHRSSDVVRREVAASATVRSSAAA